MYDVYTFINIRWTHYNVCLTGLANNQHISPGLHQQTCLIAVEMSFHKIAIFITIITTYLAVR